MTDPDPRRPAGGGGAETDPFSGSRSAGGGPETDPSSGSRWSWKSVGFALAVVVGGSFLVQLASLVAALFEVPAGFDRAALVTILFMIFATGLTVGVIGVGLFRAIGSNPQEPADPDGSRPVQRADPDVPGSP